MGCVLKDATTDPSLWVTVIVDGILCVFEKIRLRILKKGLGLPYRFGPRKGIRIRLKSTFFRFYA